MSECPHPDGRPGLACIRRGAFLEKLAQVVGSAADVTFPLGHPAFGPSDGLFVVVEVLDHPLAHQSAQLDPAGVGVPAQLLDALIGQPQSVDRRPLRFAPTVRELSMRVASACSASAAIFSWSWPLELVMSWRLPHRLRRRQLVVDGWPARR